MRQTRKGDIVAASGYLGLSIGDNEDYDVEIIALSSSSAPIASLGFARVPQSSTVEISTGAPIGARVLRLRFVARRQGTAAICAGPLSVN